MLQKKFISQRKGLKNFIVVDLGKNDKGIKAFVINCGILY